MVSKHTYLVGRLRATAARGVFRRLESQATDWRGSKSHSEPLRDA